jgi:UDP-N-acetyl-2-amino-2-deoxyglucuronate dehydrogenase
LTRNFALIGAAGFVAPRHMLAIRDTGNRLIAATDPHDSVGVMDRHFLDVRFFPEIERFDRHLEKLRRDRPKERVHYISICSPNYLHDAHVRLALRLGAHAICEKPLVIKPWNLDYLAKLEQEADANIYTVLQLREHPSVIKLKAKLDSEKQSTKHHVVLTYVTGRGAWYDLSWKGSAERSGGIAMNIGVHFFDMLQWLFGAPARVEVHCREARRMAGFLELEKAEVRWFLSVNFADLPTPPGAGMNTTHRSISMDGQEIDFSVGFGDLHTKVYEKILSGEGFGIEDARPSISLVHRIRESALTAHPDATHPLLDMERD